MLIGREGMTRAEVCEKLEIHRRTLDEHIRRIVDKSGLDGRPRRILHRLYHNELAVRAESGKSHAV